MKIKETRSHFIINYPKSKRVVLKLHKSLGEEVILNAISTFFLNYKK